MEKIIPSSKPTKYSPQTKEYGVPEVATNATQQTLRDVCSTVRKIPDIWSPYSRGSDIVPALLATFSTVFSIAPHLYLFYYSPELRKPVFFFTSLITWLLTAGLGILALEEARNALRVRRRLGKFPTNLDSNLIEEIKNWGREYIDSASTVFLVWFASGSMSYYLDFILSILSTKNNLPEGHKIYLLWPLFIVNMALAPALLSRTPSPNPDRTMLEESCQKFIQEECDTKKTTK